MAECEGKPRPVRVTLTKAQLASPTGAELAAKLAAIADDGRVTDQEIAELGAWLDAHREVELPAIAFLRDTLAKRESEPDYARDRGVLACSEVTGVRGSP